MASPQRFQTPLRHIFDAADLVEFTKSKAHKDLLGFIAALNAAVANKPVSAVLACANPAIDRLVSVLHDLEKIVESTPPIAQPMRYGNKAFRKWHDSVVERAPAFVAHVLGGQQPGAETELLSYFLDSFGNATRIDYGTGRVPSSTHNLSSTLKASLLANRADCLVVLGVFGEADLPALGLRVFPAYVRLVRKLQRTYFLEPAGSHGVWSLDDYTFLVFLFGSAQLLDHAHIRPRSIHSRDVLDACKADFMYLSAVDFINEVKSGAPFAEHSPILNDISELPTWRRVNDGLAKMYNAEVLGKLPVVQHFVFGSIFPASWRASREPVPSESMSRALASHAHGRRDQELAARLVEASSTLIPTDEGCAAVAPWVTEPIPAGVLAEVDVPLAHRTSGSGEALVSGALSRESPSASVVTEVPTVDTFLKSFGPIPHIAPPVSGGVESGSRL